MRSKDIKGSMIRISLARRIRFRNQGGDPGRQKLYILVIKNLGLNQNFGYRHSSSRLRKKCSSETKRKVSFSLWPRLNMRFLLNHNETNDLGEPKAPRVFNKE